MGKIIFIALVMIVLSKIPAGTSSKNSGGYHSRKRKVLPWLDVNRKRRRY